MPQQAAPRCFIQQSDDTVAVEVQGGSDDSLEDVVSACHQEFRWAKEEWVAVDMTEVVTVSPE